MKKETEPLILPGRRKSYSPTAMAVMELLESVIVMRLKTATEVVRILPENYGAAAGTHSFPFGSGSSNLK